MKRFKKILVATDTRYEEHPIVDKAAEIATYNQSSLKIVDVVPEMPWIARMTLKNHEELQETQAKEKNENFLKLAEPIVEKGMAVETGLLTGKTSVELIREVLRNDYDLVVAVAKGKNSKEQGCFGQTGLQLLRKCPCPVLLVTDNAPQNLLHVLGCIDTATNDPIDAELNEKIYDLGLAFSKYSDSKFSVVHAWTVWNEKMIEGRLAPESFEEHLRINRQQTEQLLDKFLKKQDIPISNENVHMIKAEAVDVIPGFVREYDVDLVVMGTVGRSGLTGALMGNTAEKILKSLDCSVLALKPASFKCPIVLV